MHHYSYHLRSENHIVEAWKRYPWLFEKFSKWESIEARYFLLEYLSKMYWYNWMLTQDAEWVPLPVETLSGEVIYWSLSHSAHYVAYCVWSSAVGIDIAEIDERDESLLSTHSDAEYTLLGWAWWRSFYILWTAKESIIKLIGSTLETMGEIRLVWSLSKDNFQYDYWWISYTVSTFQDHNITLSYTY